MTEAAEAEVERDVLSAQVASVRATIIENMLPEEIAQWLAAHFDDSPDAILATAKALIGEYVRTGNRMVRRDVIKWANEAFNV